jgi:phosphohistidine phosphatase
MRHAKAEKYTSEEDDFNRKLNKKGTAQANQLGFQLAQENFQPEKVLCSGAQRTTETAEILSHYLKFETIFLDDNLFLVDKEVLLQQIQGTKNVKSLLLIGHNFGISQLVSFLIGENILLSTSTFVEISFNLDDWKLVDAFSGSLVRKIIPDVKSF